MFRICTEHCVFSGKRTFRCGEKLARTRDGFGRRFAVDSCPFVRAEELKVPGDFFLFFADAVLLFCMC